MQQPLLAFTAELKGLLAEYGYRDHHLNMSYNAQRGWCFRLLAVAPGRITRSPLVEEDDNVASAEQLLVTLREKLLTLTPAQAA